MAADMEEEAAAVEVEAAVMEEEAWVVVEVDMAEEEVEAADMAEVEEVSFPGKLQRVVSPVLSVM